MFVSVTVSYNIITVIMTAVGSGFLPPNLNLNLSVLNSPSLITLKEVLWGLTFMSTYDPSDTLVSQFHDIYL